MTSCEDCRTAILFAPPQTRIAKEQIVPRLDYFHHRSGKSIDFFFIGYGGYMHRSQFPGMVELGEQRTSDGSISPWAFSGEVLNEVRRQIEARTPWRYSGEVELLLTTAACDAEGKVAIDFSTVIVLDL